MKAYLIYKNEFIGTYESDEKELNKEVAQHIWHLCNWSCWEQDDVVPAELKITDEFKRRGCVSSGLVIVYGSIIAYALSCGWNIVDMSINKGL